jgi:hypothetical protein
MPVSDLIVYQVTLTERTSSRQVNRACSPPPPFKPSVSITAEPGYDLGRAGVRKVLLPVARSIWRAERVAPQACVGDRGTQGHRGRQAPVPGGAEEPQTAADHLSPHHPVGYPLAERLEQARAEQDAGANPLGLIFPSPRGKHWRSSNFNRNVLKPAYLTAGWRDPDSSGEAS